MTKNEGAEITEDDLLEEPDVSLEEEESQVKIIEPFGKPEL